MPIETEQDKGLLQAWLQAFLEDTTDADSDLLSQYVVAIIGSAPDITEEALKNELAEFLDDQAAFVASSLLTALRTNSYRNPLPKPAPSIPTAPSVPPTQFQTRRPSGSGQQTIPIRAGPPANAPTGPRSSNSTTLTNGSTVTSPTNRKRSLSRGSQAAAQRRDRDRGRDRDGNARRSASPSRVVLVDGRAGEEVGTSAGMRGSGRGRDGDAGVGGRPAAGSSSRPSARKELCRDYHERGYCPRGMECVFEHSEDSMYAPHPPPNADGSAPFPLPGMPGFPLLPNGLPDVTAYLAMGMGMGGMQGMQGMLGMGSPGGDGGGAGTRMIGSPFGNMMQGGQGQGQPGQPHDEGTYSPHQPGGPPAFPPPGMFPPGMQMPFGMPMPMPMMGGFPPGSDFMGGRGGRGGPVFGRGGRGGRGRGGFGNNGVPSGSGGDPGRFAGQAQPPKDRGTTTLVLTDIPREHLSVESIQTQFKKHGTVTNVAIEASQRKALVSFSSNAEAFSAWRDPEPVFGNRHVKVLWHRPTGEMGAAGQAKLAASAALLENMRKIEEQGVEAVQGTRMTPAQIRQQVEKVKRNGLELEKNLAEQKILMARLTNKTNPISPEEKPTARARLKELSAAYTAMKEAHQEDNELLTKIKESQEKTKKRLDAIQAAQKEAKRVREEGEGVHAMDDLMSVDAPAGGDEEVDSETLQLRAKLAALRKQATSMGIDPSNPVPASSSASQPFVPHGRRTLDNRPTALLLSPTAGEPLPPNALHLARQHYEDILVGLPQSLKTVRGEKISLVTDVRLVEGGKKALVSFGSRAVAEAALRSGTLLPSFPSLSAAWHVAPTDTSALPAEHGAGHAATGPEVASTMDGIEVEYKRGEREDDE